MFNRIVAGPCSAETESQVFRTAELLSAIGITHYRAGLWKPRTSPDSFEGVGQCGLRWLERVKAELGLKVGTEVANGEHLAQAISIGIDFVWLGAVERLQKVGIARLVAVHRGFHTGCTTSIYRNPPQWQVPIEFKRRRPDIPLLCDPSHISGNSVLVETVVRQASRLGFDGLMVEVHCEPQRALSDRKQQITPEQLDNILQGIRFGSAQSDSDEMLSVFRARIDEIDRSLFDIVAQRMELSDKIGEYKKANDISVLQLNRYRELLSNSLAYAERHNLNKDFVKQLVELIHQESINRQL